MKVGIDPAYVSDLESGRKVRHPSARVFIRLAEALRIDPNELFTAAGYLNQPTPPPSGIARFEREVAELQQHLNMLSELLRHRALDEIPVSGTIENDTCDISLGVIVDRILLPSAYVALSVADNSLENLGIPRGEVVIVDLNNRNPDNGQIAIVRLATTGEVRLKRFFKEDGRVRLEPFNAGWMPVVASDIEVLGIVIMSLHKFS